MKTRIRLILPLLLTLFAATPLAFAQSGKEQTPAPPAPEELPTRLHVDPGLMLQMKCVWDVIARPDNPIWPGWNAQDTPVLFYIPGVQEVLLNHPAPPKEFAPYRGPLLKSFPSLLVRDGETSIEYDGQNTSRVLFGEQTLIVADTLSNQKNWLRGWAMSPADIDEKLSRLNYSSLRPDPYSQMDMIAHEAFHVFQYKHLKRDLKGDQNVRYYPCLSVDNNVKFALEATTMINAINAPTREEARKHALQWLALRLDRRKDLDPRAVVFEDDNEFMEGLATYAGLACLQELEGRELPISLFFIQGFNGVDDLSWYRANRLDALSKFMRGEQIVNNDPFGAAGIRFRLYYSGMGIALMLDRLSGNIWKKEIAETQISLTNLLHKKIAPQGNELASALSAALAHEEYSELLTTKQKLAEDGHLDNQKMLSEILEGPNTLLEFDWSDFSDEKIGLTYTSFGLRSLDEDRVIYTLVPISAQLKEGYGGFKQQTPRPTLENSSTNIIQFQLKKAISTRDLQATLGMPNNKSWTVNDLNLNLPGVTVTAKKAMLKLDGKRLTIKVLNVN